MIMYHNNNVLWLSNLVFSHHFFGICKGHDLAGIILIWPNIGTIPAHLTLKHRKTHGCVVSTVAPDALVLKHQAISIHNAD